MGHRFDGSYSEPYELRDGSRVELRLVRESDEALFRAGFERLSDQSRYRRFHSPKPRLSERELHYLTHIDQESHFALGAVRLDPLGRESPMGVARFVCLPEDPAVAEAAVTVLDDAQGIGLGSVLLVRLVAAARERGVERFRCYVQADNDEMRDLMHYVIPAAEDHREGDDVLIEAPLPEVDGDIPLQQRLPGHWTYDLMRRAASGTLEIIGDLRRHHLTQAYAALRGRAQASAPEGED